MILGFYYNSTKCLCMTNDKLNKEQRVPVLPIPALNTEYDITYNVLLLFISLNSYQSFFKSNTP